MAMLGPDMLAYLQRLNLGAAGQPTDGATPPPPATVQAPAAPASSDVGPNPMQDLMRQYVQNYGSAGLRNAQRQDVGDLITNRTGRQLAGAASLISGANVTPPDVAQPWHAAQFGQGRELAGQNMQMAGQMMAMDPNSPMSRIKVETAKGLGLPVGPGWSAWHVDQLLDAMGKGQAPMKTAAEITKTVSEGRKAGAEAHGSELENGPPSPAMQEMAQKYGVKIAQGDTTRQVRETIDAEAKRRGQQLDWAKLGLEGRKMDVEMARYRSDHPDEPVPGYVFSGPPGTAAPGRDSPEVQTLGEKVAAAGEMKTILGEMRDIYDRNGTSGRLVGPDATRLDQLHEKLLGTIGRAASGGKLAAYDITLAHEQLPRPSNIKGALRSDNIHAAIDQLTKDADVGHREWARAHNFTPKPGPSAAKGSSERRTLADGRTLEKLPDGSIRVVE